MGYQGVAIKVQPYKNANEMIKEIQEKAKAENIDMFIWLIGTYNKDDQVEYLVYDTVRHPGADLLQELYKTNCLDMDLEEVYEELEECYSYKSIDEN